MESNERPQASAQRAAALSVPAAACPAEPVWGAPANDLPPHPLALWLSSKAQLYGVLASLLLARLYVELWKVPKHMFGPLACLFTLLFLTLGEVWFRLREKAGAPVPAPAVRRESRFWAVCTAALPLACWLGRCNAVSGWWLLFWHGFAAYWVLCRAGLLSGGTTGAAFAWDALCTILLPAREFSLGLRTLWQGLARVRLRRRAGNCSQTAVTLLCLACAAPLLLLALRLLTDADVGFRFLVQGLSRQLRFALSAGAQQQLLELLLALPVGAWLYGLAGGAAHRSGPQVSAMLWRRKAEVLRVVPRTAPTLIFGAFCTLYAAFFAVQAGYLFSAFAGRLPAGFSAAQYARQGFFELCGVLLLNFGLLTLCARLSARPVRSLPVLRGLCLALMAACLLFCATVAAKLGLYISLFGFTPRRLLSFWAVLEFSSASALAMLTLIRPQEAIGKLVWFAAASFAVLCFLY